MDKSILGDVSPDKYFYARNERVIKSLNELLEAVREMDDDTYKHHVNEERNDFSEWIKHVIGYKKLANSVKHTNSKDEMAQMYNQKRLQVVLYS